jgi:hypothetical protein
VGSVQVQSLVYRWEFGAEQETFSRISKMKEITFKEHSVGIQMLSPIRV